MIGQWYLDLANEQQFKVVARDEDSIEVQYLDGGVAAYDGEEWQCLDIALTAAPEDWSGALEPVDLPVTPFSDTTTSANPPFGPTT